MKKKKSKKKIIIGAAAVLVVAGGVTVAGQRNSTENQIPQVQVVIAEKGDVEEIVDATGTVGSEEEKTYYSPVNAELKTVSFAQGDVVKKGTKLIEFNTEDLEKDNRKAELNLKSTKSVSYTHLPCTLTVIPSRERAFRTSRNAGLEIPNSSARIRSAGSASPGDVYKRQG